MDPRAPPGGEPVSPAGCGTAPDARGEAAHHERVNLSAWVGLSRRRGESVVPSPAGTARRGGRPRPAWRWGPPGEGSPPAGGGCVCLCPAGSTEPWGELGEGRQAVTHPLAVRKGGRCGASCSRGTRGREDAESRRERRKCSVPALRM